MPGVVLFRGSRDRLLISSVFFKKKVGVPYPLHPPTRETSLAVRGAKLEVLFVKGN